MGDSLRNGAAILLLALSPAFFKPNLLGYTPKIFFLATVAASYYITRYTVRTTLGYAMVLWLAGLHSIGMATTLPLLGTDKINELVAVVTIHGIFGAGYWFLFKCVIKNASAKSASSGVNAAGSE